MTKFYRVLKETPLWEEGAIISNEVDANTCDGYRPISDLFVKDIEGLNEDWYEGEAAVEKQPEWFERVYPIGELKKQVFGNKIQAKAAATAMFKDK